MQQKIFDTKNSYEFFTRSREIVLEEETKLEMNPSSKFGLDIIDTGKFHLIISTELTEEFIGISNDSLKKHPLLKLVREEKISGEKYLVFSTIPIPNEIIFHVEIFLEKTIIVHCLMKLVSSNRDNFSTQNLLKVIGLDLQEYLDLEDNLIKQTKFIMNELITKATILEQLKYTTNLIQVAKDKKVVTMAKILKCLLIYGLTELFQEKVKDYINDSIEYEDYLYFKKSPNKVKLLTDHLFIIAASRYYSDDFKEIMHKEREMLNSIETTLDYLVNIEKNRIGL